MIGERPQITAATQRVRVFATSGRLLPELRWMVPTGILVIVCLAAIFAPILAPHDPLRFDVTHRLGPSTWQHPLGTDQFGRDVLSQIIFGARASMAIAAGSSILALLIGVPLGLIGGYFSGWIELITMRPTDVVLSFPPIVLAVLVVTLFGPGVVTLILVMAILYFPTFARIAFGEVIRLKQLEYVEAARALGSNHFRTMFDTILPNLLAPIIVQFSLTAAAAILTESGLSFLGLGVVPPTPSWGLMIRESRTYMLQHPSDLMWPCLAIVVTILALNTLGDVLRDVLDPRLLIHRA